MLAPTNLPPPYQPTPHDDFNRSRRPTGVSSSGGSLQTLRAHSTVSTLLLLLGWGLMSYIALMTGECLFPNMPDQLSRRVSALVIVQLDRNPTPQGRRTMIRQPSPNANTSRFWGHLFGGCLSRPPSRMSLEIPWMALFRCPAVSHIMLHTTTQ